MGYKKEKLSVIDKIYIRLIIWEYIMLFSCIEMTGVWWIISIFTAILFIVMTYYEIKIEAITQRSNRNHEMFVDQTNNYMTSINKIRR